MTAPGVDGGAFRARISPVPEGVPRPLWSVLIPTWNCARFLEETLRSVLDQDPGEPAMEIIVVDDHSTADDPEEVVRRIGGSRVAFVRQPENVGKVRNYETGLSMSRGHLIHQLHGDDRVKTGFYASMERAFRQFRDAGSVFCACSYIDEDGRVTGRTGEELQTAGVLPHWLDRIVVEQLIQTPSIVLKRDVYEALGGFDRRLDAMEDWEMWIRVASRFPVAFIPEPLAEYRWSSGNATSLTILSGAHGRVARQVMDIVAEYLPQQVMQQTSDARNKALAQSIIQFIPGLVRKRRLREFAAVCRDALSFSRDPQTLYRIVSYTAAGLRGIAS